MPGKKKKKVTLTKALSKPVQRYSPKEISEAKNAIQQAKSKATLKALARYNPSSPKTGGAILSFRGREFTKRISTTSKLNLKTKKATIGVEVNPKSKPKYRQISGRKTIVKQLGRY